MFLFYTIFFSLMVSVIKYGVALSGNSTDEINELNHCGKVFLTVSSYKNTFLEMNWVISSCKLNDSRRPDLIALYDADPRSRYTNKLVEIDPLNHVDEVHRTTIPFGTPKLPGNWNYEKYIGGNYTEVPTPGTHCFPYWIASLKNNSIIQTECFKIQPTWMADNSKELENLKIGKAFIPGAHNAGTKPSTDVITFLDTFTVNQDRDIWTQLVFGIRHLDIRIAYYKQTDEFTVNHDLIRFGNVELVFDQIKTFLKLAPKEVVILDLHRFPYPEKFPHERLVRLIKSKFLDTALPQGISLNRYGPTFKEIWDSRQNIIICYTDRKTLEKNSDFLWRPIVQYWGNKRSTSSLKSFIRSTIDEISNSNIHNAYTNPLWAIMAELTPSKFDIIFGINELRDLADKVNLPLTKWLRNGWANEVNIVATDFFLGNDLINLAIETNINKNR